MHIPPKLASGDTVRVVAPARSLPLISQENIARAVSKLSERFKLKVEFSEHINDTDWQGSGAVKSRVEDLHSAFRAQHVRCVLTVIGGFNSNELLPLIDYELIRRNPKILCGYSDITALCTAVTKKCDLVTYSGPHFSTFAMEDGGAFTEDWFERVLFGGDERLALTQSERFREDEWYLQGEPKLQVNTGHVILSPTHRPVTGRIMAGNLAGLGLLQGTEYLPKWPEMILFVEWCAEAREGLNLAMFVQRLHSLLQALRHVAVRGLLIGRMEQTSAISLDDLKRLVGIIKDNGLLPVDAPVVANVDFGHTFPMITIPIGGIAEISPEGGISFCEFQVEVAC